MASVTKQGLQQDVNSMHACLGTARSGCLKELWRRNMLFQGIFLQAASPHLSCQQEIIRCEWKDLRSVLINGCETSPVCDEDAQRIFEFHHRSVWRIARVWSEHLVSIDKVSHHVLGADSRLWLEMIALCHLRWPGHALRVSVHRLLFRALFAPAEQSWKKGHGFQLMNWRKGTRKSALALSLVRASHYSGWDEDYCELGTLTKIDQNWRQWCECCVACL